MIERREWSHTGTRYRWLIVSVLVLIGLLSGTASAYPQFAGRGEFDCTECHYSPTGGGLLNQWGRQSREVSFSSDSFPTGDPDNWWGHDDARLDDSSEANRLHWDVGLDSRILAVVAPGTAVVIPMMLEAGAVATYGSWQIYGTVGARKGSPQLPFVARSREYWLLYGITDQVFVRAGRMVLPFGLRMSDHTQYLREDFGFGPWGQSNALQLDWSGEKSTFSGAGFVGDFLGQEPALRERGAMARGTYRFIDSLELGASALVARSDAVKRWSAGATFRWQVMDSTYALGEVARQTRGSRQSTSELKTDAGFLRVGFFVKPELDIYVELGRRQITQLGWLTATRVAAGAVWQAWNLLELSPQLMMERTDGLGRVFTGTLQAHLLY